MSPIVSNVNTIPNVIDEITIGGGPPALADIDNVFSMEFDGMDDRIDCGELNSFTNKLSISGWAYPTAYDAYHRRNIVGKNYPNWGGLGQKGYNLTLTVKATGELMVRFYIGSDGNTPNAGAAQVDAYGSGYTINTWYHVVGTWDGTDMKLYLNGNMTPIATATLTTNITYQAGVQTQIGVVRNTYNDFIGRLDEIALWDIELSATEVNAIFDATSTGITADLSTMATPPVAWYRMGD